MPAVGQMPFYFSGTNAYISGLARSDSNEEKIVEAWLYLNNELVKHLAAAPGGEPVGGIALAVVFDSSHFAPNSVVTVTIVGKNDVGAIFSGSNTAIVLNRAVGFNAAEFWQPGKRGTDALAGVLYNQNYDTAMTFGGGWSHLNIASDLTNTGIYYENSHGSVGTHKTDAVENDGSAIFMTGLEVQSPALPERSYEHWRQIWNGAALPPYNTSAMFPFPHVPPVHYAQMDSCESGGTWSGQPDASFSEILFPHYNADFPGVRDPDVAVLTWKCFTDAWTTENGVYWMFSGMTNKGLRNGSTVFRARSEMVLHNADYPGTEIRVSPDETPGSFVTLSSTDQVPVLGDLSTKIKAVWYGSLIELAYNPWYR